MRIYEDTYWIEPVPKGRPRFTRSGHAYTPPKTHFYEKGLRELYAGEKFEGAIGISFVFGMPIPKSTSKRTREKMLNGEIHHCKKGDLDNLVKAATDALNGLAYDDDSQIVYLYAKKRYADEPYVYVKIWEVE